MQYIYIYINKQSFSPFISKVILKSSIACCSEENRNMAAFDIVTTEIHQYSSK